MRGVAAVAVLFYHFRFFFSPDHSFPGGYLAVDFFFVLSGFVIGHAYDDRIGRGMTSAEFVERRLIRFLPLLWLGIALGAAGLVYELMHGAADFTKRDIILGTFHNALLLPTNFGKGNLLFPTDWPEWSLFMELAVNIAYVIFHKHLTNRILQIVVPFGLIALVLITLHFGNLNAGVAFQDVYAGVVRVVFSFFAGPLIYRTRSLWSARLPKVSMWWLMTMLALALFLPVGPPYRAAYDIVFAVAVSPLLVMIGSVSPPPPRLSSFAAWLGVISYPIYVIHDPVVRWHELLYGRVIGSWWAIATIVATIAVAAPLEQIYHRRVGGWLSRMAGTRLSDF